MKRIAILGGGISGLTAAYELELARKRGAALDWHLYEATDRLGGIIQTTRHHTDAGDYILEGGPDGWVSEKPWATELAIELGLEDQLIYSNDATRKTYILKPSEAAEKIAGKLLPIPDRMRLMVPEDLSALENSPLFSKEAKQAYAHELANAAELKAASPFVESVYDESVAAFVLRHFGEEVLAKLAAPLLSGVFGGDIHKLSVRAVMPQFVAMERDHGSLIAALQAKSSQRMQPPKPIFTSLRNGMGSLIDALVARLPSERLHLNVRAHELLYEVYPGNVEWSFWIDKGDVGKATHTHGLSGNHIGFFDHLILATPLDATWSLLKPWDAIETTLLPSSHGPFWLLPTEASSAVLATFCWPSESARAFTLLQGFGFLVPQIGGEPDFRRHPERSEGPPHFAGEGSEGEREPQLLACTFVHQKFPDRAPAGSRILRVFFGSNSAEGLANASDEAVASLALEQLTNILGSLPSPDAALTEVRRWPRSLPQYEVGHLGRMADLDDLVARIGNLTLLGNSYRGVGLPDLIRDARAAARALIPNP